MKVEGVRGYFRFLRQSLHVATEGNAVFYAWMFVLSAVALVGANAWAVQVRDGMVRTLLARQLGDTSETVWLHLRGTGPIDRVAFAAEIERLQEIARAVPQIEPVL